MLVSVEKQVSLGDDAARECCLAGERASKGSPVERAPCGPKDQQRRRDCWIPIQVPVYNDLATRLSLRSLKCAERGHSMVAAWATKHPGGDA
jgi:hypothetical protein